MLNLRHSQHGVTLIELMIAMVIFGILFMFVAPGYSTWIQNQQIRTGAESILNGIQLARSTAVKNNAPVRFNLCGTASSWQILAASSTAAAASAADTFCGAGVTVTAGNEIRIQDRTSQEGSKSAGILATSITPPPTTIPITDDGSRSVTFNSFGRVVANDPAVGGNPITTIEVATPNGNRQLLIIVQNPGGSVKMCDPSPLLPATDPRHC